MLLRQPTCQSERNEKVEKGLGKEGKRWGKIFAWVRINYWLRHARIIAPTVCNLCETRRRYVFMDCGQVVKIQPIAIHCTTSDPLTLALV